MTPPSISLARAEQLLKERQAALTYAIALFDQRLTVEAPFHAAIIRGYKDTLLALREQEDETQRLRDEIAEAREACPSIRQQDNFDAPPRLSPQGVHCNRCGDLVTYVMLPPDQPQFAGAFQRGQLCQECRRIGAWLPELAQMIANVVVNSMRQASAPPPVPLDTPQATAAEIPQ